MDAEYIKSLEVINQKQERIIQDLIADRDSIVSAFSIMHKNFEDLREDVKNLYEPVDIHSPSTSPTTGQASKSVDSMKNTIRETMRAALLKKVMNDINICQSNLHNLSFYAKSDPTDYVISGKHYLFPILTPLKGK